MTNSWFVTFSDEHIQVWDRKSYKEAAKINKDSQNLYDNYEEQNGFGSFQIVVNEFKKILGK